MIPWILDMHLQASTCHPSVLFTCAGYFVPSDPHNRGYMGLNRSQMEGECRLYHIPASSTLCVNSCTSLIRTTYTFPLVLCTGVVGSYVYHNIATLYATCHCTCTLMNFVMVSSKQLGEFVSKSCCYFIHSCHYIDVFLSLL